MYNQFTLFQFFLTYIHKSQLVANPCNVWIINCNYIIYIHFYHVIGTIIWKQIKFYNSHKKAVEILFKEILVSFYSSIGYIFFICSLRFCKSEIISIIIWSLYIVKKKTLHKCIICLEIVNEINNILICRHSAK